MKQVSLKAVDFKALQWTASSQLAFKDPTVYKEEQIALERARLVVMSSLRFSANSSSYSLYKRSPLGPYANWLMSESIWHPRRLLTGSIPLGLSNKIPPLCTAALGRHSTEASLLSSWEVNHCKCWLVVASWTLPSSISDITIWISWGNLLLFLLLLPLSLSQTHELLQSLITIKNFLQRRLSQLTSEHTYIAITAKPSPHITYSMRAAPQTFRSRASTSKPQSMS